MRALRFISFLSLALEVESVSDTSVGVKPLVILRWFDSCELVLSLVLVLYCFIFTAQIPLRVLRG